MPGHEHDREGIQQRAEDGEPQRHPLDGLADFLDELQVISLDDREVGDIWRQLLTHRHRQPEPRGDVVRDGAEVQRDRPLVDRDVAFAAVDDRDEELVGSAVGPCPEILNAWTTERERRCFQDWFAGTVVMNSSAVSHIEMRRLRKREQYLATRER